MISIQHHFLQEMDSPSPLHSSEESSSYPSTTDAFDDFLNEGYGLEEEEKPLKNGKKPAASTAEKRATHNAVERARRETLNGRFTDLAQILPNMRNIKRPSKSAIVNKSIEYVQTSINREASLVAQNDALRIEVNELRARLGMPALTTTPASVTLPLGPVPRKREASIGSQASSAPSKTVSLTTGSPSASSTSHMSPASVGFELPMTSPLPQQASQLSNLVQPGLVNPAAMLPAFQPTDRRVSQPNGLAGLPPQHHQQMPSLQTDLQSTIRSAPFSPVDLGYMLGLQQLHAMAQQPPSMLGLQTPMAGLPVWQNPFASAPTPAPVAAGGPDTINWLFA